MFSSIMSMFSGGGGASGGGGGGGGPGSGNSTSSSAGAGDIGVSTGAVYYNPGAPAGGISPVWLLVAALGVALLFLFRKK